MTKHASILGQGAIFRLLCWEVHLVPNNICNGPSNGSFWAPKKKEKKENL
jgi:hypothetical protein